LVLPGATIYIHEIRTGAISNNNGVYKSRYLNPGRYLVEVSYQGYASEIETIKIQGNTEQNFSLIPAIVEQQAVTVTGVSSATRVKQSSQPVIIIKPEDLIQTTSSNAIDALSKIVPGVSSVSTGPAISKPIIRGLGYNRVVTVNNGVRQEGQQWGDEHGIEIDDYSIQRVEILKGPASLMYGSDALAGVINIITHTPVLENSLKANFLSEYQTNSRLRGFYGDIGASKNGFNWSLYGSYKGAQDYKNQLDGYVFNSKFYNKNFGATAGYGGSWGSTQLYISNFSQQLGMIEGDRDSATGYFVKQSKTGDEVITSDADFRRITPLVPYQQIEHSKITSDNSFHLRRSRLDITLGFQRNQRKEFGDASNITTPDAYFDLKTFNYSGKFHLPYVNNWKTTVGITGMVQNNRNRGEEALIPNYESFDLGGFVFTHYAKNKMALSGGIRLDNRHLNSRSLIEDSNTKFAAFTKSFANLSGNAGVSYLPSDQLTLKLNLSRGFRAPNMAELSSNGAHEGTNRYEIGNKDLKSEISLQLDAGIEISSRHVSFAANLFYNHIDNFIFYQKVLNTLGGDSILIDEESGNNLNVFEFRQHNSNLYGGEVNIDIHPHPLDWLHFQNTIAYTRALFTKQIEGTKNIPLIPAARWVSELKGSFLTKGQFVRNLYASIESDYTFKQNHPFTAFNTETETKSYMLINASLGTDITNKGKTLFTLHLAANNLADVAYQNHLSRLKYTSINNVTGRQGVYNMGRNFSVKLKVPLSIQLR
jgi:iron complex outermembrane receptor protein